MKSASEIARAPVRACIATMIAISMGEGNSHAQTSYPMVSRVEPVAVTRGQTVELTISGDQSFAGATSILAEPPGVVGAVIGEIKDARPAIKGRRKGQGRPRGSVKAKLTVSPETPLGPREIRVGTPQGVSSVGLVVVVNDPVVGEAEDSANNRSEGSQPLTLPSVIAGKIGVAEDVDWYSFEGQAGQDIVFEVWANRLENKIHDLQTHFDPILSIFDAEGRELQAADNQFFADPMLSYRLPTSGKYFVQIRDTTYAGNPSWVYALHATKGPVATSTFPIAINPGKVARLSASGFNFDPKHPITLDVPKDLEPGMRLFDLPTESGKTLPIPLVVTTLPVVTEQGDTANSVARAQKIELPAAICGRLGEPGDIDVYAFQAVKGKVYSFEVIARRAYAECDPVVYLLNGSGSPIVENDDSPGHGKDTRFEWTAPADCTYAIQISDLHSRGGQRSGYAILAEEAKPDFELACDPDKLNVGPGSRVPLFVRVTRRQGFKGPVSLTWDKLPAGVSVSSLTIPPNMTEGVVVVSASAEAVRGSHLIGVNGVGTISDKEKLTLKKKARAREEIYMPGGGRSTLPVETLALAVTDPSDIIVDIPTTRLTLTPGETVTLDVTVKRKDGFTGSVNLAIVLEHLGGVHGNPLPRGVTLQADGSKTLLAPSETKGKVILKAAHDAPPCTDVPITIMGHVSINFVVKTAYCSEPILISVKPK